MNSMMDRRTLLRGLGALSLAGAAGGLNAGADTILTLLTIHLQ